MERVIASKIIEYTSRLLEYVEGFCFAAEEMLYLAMRVKELEAPLTLFVESCCNNEHASKELDQIIDFWLGNFSPEARQIFRETILSGSNRIIDRLVGKISDAPLLLLSFFSIPVSTIGDVQDRFSIYDKDSLLHSLQGRNFSRAGLLSSEEEQLYLSKILRGENCLLNTTGCLDFEEIYQECQEEATHDVSDPELLFHANADFLADQIIQDINDTFNTLVYATNSLTSRRKRKALDWRRHFKSFMGEEDPSPRFEDELYNGAAKDFSLLSRTLNVVKVGPLRRKAPVIERLDFLVEADWGQREQVFALIKKANFVAKVVREQSVKLTVLLDSDFVTLPYNNRRTPSLEINFYCASPFIKGTVETLLTSAPVHWKMLQSRASAKGWNLTAVGLYDGVFRLASRTADHLYNRLGLPFIPPELREGVVEQEWVKNQRPRLVFNEDIRADLHMHTTFSDGTGSVEEMVDVARSLNLEYIALTDHTKNVVVANGMSDIDVLRYWSYLDEFNSKFKKQNIPFRILKGVEVDVLENGDLDLADETLAQADWVVASIHFGKRQPREQIEARYLKAMKSPYVDVIAHPTQRIIGGEAAMDVSVDFLCENAQKYGKCLELNSQPRRLDLCFEGVVLARQKHVPIVISSDAHRTRQISYLRFGVEQAQRAGCSPSDILNTLPLNLFLERRPSQRHRRNISI